MFGPLLSHLCEISLFVVGVLSDGERPSNTNMASHTQRQGLTLAESAQTHWTGEGQGESRGWWLGPGQGPVRPELSKYHEFNLLYG